MSDSKSMGRYFKAGAELVKSVADLIHKNVSPTIKVGDLAPDFELPTKDGDRKIRLSSFQNQKPVVLIFGSYT